MDDFGSPITNGDGAARTSAGGMSTFTGILTALRRDHGEMSAMMRRIGATEEHGKRAVLFHEFRGRLLAHAEAEEASFYTALSRHRSVEPLASEGAREHQQTLDSLRQLDALSPSSPEWSDRFAELERSVRQHIEKEERRMFELARRVLTEGELERLEQQFSTLKQTALSNHV